VVIHQKFESYSWRQVTTTNWRRGLPVLRDRRVTLRELRVSDAPALLHHVSGESSTRHISRPPSTVDDFRRFIRWTQTQRRRGRHVCFGIVPAGQTTVVGLVQIWAVEPDLSTSEWGFVIGDSHWGTGLFPSAARLALDFAFSSLGVNRLEARAVINNARGNAVLKKLGAKREGTLRRGFRQGDGFVDQSLWSILADDWAQLRRADDQSGWMS